MGINHNDSQDSGITPDAQSNSNNNVNADPCEPMDARSSGAACLPDEPLGLSWDGERCVEVWCDCLGEDCGNLYETASRCWSARAPLCVEPHACLNEPYDTCVDRPDCQVVYYGGGCLNLDDCTPGGPGEDNWICWERGIACVPADHPCTQREWGDCDGECYWWERTQELCFEQCCMEESYGYCAPVPGENGDCAAQDISFCSEPCLDIVGWRWDGEFCRPVGCCCEGPDCGEMYATWEACVTDRLGCTGNTCSTQGGYCDYGDAEPGSCQEGYYIDEDLGQQEPGVCGLGVCCTPCLEPIGTDFGYVGHSPEECLGIDWDCFSPDYAPFQNACGCGCYRPLNGNG